MPFFQIQSYSGLLAKERKKKKRGSLSSISFVVTAVPEGQRGKLEKIPVNTSLITSRIRWSNQAVKQGLLQTGPSWPLICAEIWRIQKQWWHHSSSLELWFSEEMGFTPNPNREQLGAKLSSPNSKKKSQLYKLIVIWMTSSPTFIPSINLLLTSWKSQLTKQSILIF